jgi:large subunit ribosomal protein L18
VQFIDDAAAKTLAAVSHAAGRAEGPQLNVATAQELGPGGAEAAKDKGIAAVVFDRGGFAYRGRLKALADAAREGGLQVLAPDRHEETDET